MRDDKTIIDLSAVTTQVLFSEVIGINRPMVSELISRGVIKKGDPIGKWIKDYTADLRAKAARWGGAGEHDLAAERARLAAEQADKIALQNAISRKEFAPVSVIEETLANMGRQIAGKLEKIPVDLKRKADASQRVIKIAEEVISEARNTAATIKPDWSQISDGQSED